MKNSKWSAAFFAVLLFFGGAVVGALAQRYYTLETVHARPTADTMRKAYASEMKDRLALTPTQMGKLDEIMDQTHARFKSFREEHRAEFERISQEQTSAVRAILTPEQLPKFDKLVAEREERRRKHDPHD